jgi:c-di-GMP-binding flagellar brake protein YcgR
MSMAQRRRWERFRKTLDVTIRTPEGRTISARTQDLCEGGLGLLSPEALAVGSACSFMIAEIDQAPLSGTVRWCTPSPRSGENVVGVELTALTSRQTSSLAERIARWREEDVAAGDDR